MCTHFASRSAICRSQWQTEWCTHQTDAPYGRCPDSSGSPSRSRDVLRVSWLLSSLDRWMGEPFVFVRRGWRLARAMLSSPDVADCFGARPSAAPRRGRFHEQVSPVGERRRNREMRVGGCVGCNPCRIIEIFRTLKRVASSPLRRDNTGTCTILAKTSRQTRQL